MTFNPMKPKYLVGYKKLLIDLSLYLLIVIGTGMFWRLETGLLHWIGLLTYMFIAWNIHKLVPVEENKIKENR